MSDYYEEEWDGDRQLTVAQVRGILPLSKARIYQLTKSGELPSTQIGRRQFVRPADLREFIADHARQIDPLDDPYYS